MKNQEIKFKNKKSNYSIIVGKNSLKFLPNKIRLLCPRTKKIALFLDKKVPKKFKTILKKKLKKYEVLFIQFNANEKNKSINTVNYYLKILLSKNFNRSDLIISVGGGITGDTVGFVASIFKRGINFINIPTTLLAQVDSAVGGKTGVNSVYGKNLIGSFYQPDLVITDTKLLASLPKREIICGYAEILKHSLIKNRKLFLFLDKNLQNILGLKKNFIEKVILESCKIKKRVVENDEKEVSVRKSLNLGHTFGHAYEAALNYSKKLNHGEAVLYGILSATKLSKKLKMLNNNEYNLILSHLSKLKFTNINKFFNKKNINKIVMFMVADKKNFTNKINFITLNKIGSVSINNQLNINKVRNFIKSELIK